MLLGTLIVILTILLFLWFLFVFSFYVELSFTIEQLRIKVFGIPIIRIKDEKYISLINKIVPKNKETLKKEIDYSSLIQFVHIDLMDIKCSYLIDDYSHFVYQKTMIDFFHYSLEEVLKNYIRKYHFTFIQGTKNIFQVKTSIHFNIGTILLNVIEIKSRYKKNEN